MDSPKFQELYKQLNPEQKEAVDHIEGPVMVVAGPGTGKTQVLTLRIANILLKTQINPGNILALTFSESGAATMRRRLAEIIGPAAYQVQTATFHGFCNDLIKNHPEEFPEIIGRRPSDEASQIEILQKIIGSSRLKILKPFGEPYFYLPAIRRAISSLKKEGFTPEDFESSVKEERGLFGSIDDLYYESGRYKGKMKGKYAEQKKHLDKNAELAGIYFKYQESLAESKLYDYDDMILLAGQSLAQNAEFLLKLQEKYQYFLVDEHQDTNNAQNKVLELLCNFYETPNLFVVGDEKQTIFRFQGASLANFLYFKKTYPEARLVTLNKNYRSTQPILDLAHSIIRNNSVRLAGEMPEIKDELLSQSKTSEQKIEIYEFKRPETEAYFLGEKISELIKNRTPAKEIAVIYRDNKDVSMVADVFGRYGLPFRIESSSNALEDEDVKRLLDVFKFVSDPSDEEKLFSILCSGHFNIPSLDVYKLTSPNIRKRPLLELMADEKRLKELKIASYAGIKNLADNLLDWHKLARHAALAEVFEKVLHGGFLRLILAKSDSVSKLSKLNSVFAEVKKISSLRSDARLKDFINHLSTLERYNVGIKNGGIGYIPEAVRLMTAHGAKGLEFDHVFLINSFDGHWGNRRIPKLIKLPNLDVRLGANNLPLNPVAEGERKVKESNGLLTADVANPRLSIHGSLMTKTGQADNIGFWKKKQSRQFRHWDDGTGSPGLGEGTGLLATSHSRLELDDERRLFYVALTRARKMAYISYALERSDGKECVASQFVTEIKPGLASAGDAGEYEKGLDGKNYLLSMPKTGKGFSVFEKDYLRDLFKKRGLSATAVNNFLTCPWKYFYLNLLRIPKAKSRYQIYGSAVHTGLKSFFDQLNYDKNNPEVLFLSFRKALEKEPLAQSDLETFSTKGAEALKKYFDYYNGNWVTKTQNEFRVQNVFLRDNIKLTGSLDKVEFYADNVPFHPDPGNQSRRFPPSGSPSATGFKGILSASNYDQVNVVDYKTGKPISRNELEGKTKNSTGDYKRQLVFYKLLLDLYPGNKFNMISGELDFVEPDAKGVFHKEKFFIDSSEVDGLKQTVLGIADKVVNFKFENEKCSGKNCEFCKLKFGNV